MKNREIDALVAEKVFSERVLRHPAFVDGPQINPSDGGRRRHLPEYSTDISAAWQVVDKLKIKYFVCIQDCHSPEYAWCCVLSERTMDGAVYEGLGASAPEAICLAALKAMGHEVREEVK